MLYSKISLSVVGIVGDVYAVSTNLVWIDQGMIHLGAKVQGLVYDQYNRFAVFKRCRCGNLCNGDIADRFKGLVKSGDIACLPGEA
jgi:hypothetical protein